MEILNVVRLGVTLIMGMSVVMIIVGCGGVDFRSMVIDIIDMKGVVEWVVEWRVSVFGW